MKKLVRRVAAGTLLLSTTACFSYRPVGEARPERATTVRVHLSSPAAFDIGEVVVQNVARAEGEVAGWSGDTLSLSATLLVSTAGQDFLVDGRTLSIPGSQVGRIEQRRLSPLRSALLVAAGAVLINTADRIVGGIGRSGDGNGGDGTNTQ